MAIIIYLVTVLMERPTSHAVIGMKIEIVCFTGNSGLTDYAVSLSRALTRLMAVTMVTAESLPTPFSNMGFAVLRVFRRTRHYPIDIIRFTLGVCRRKPDWILIQGPIKFPIVDALIIRIVRKLGIRAAVTIHDVLPHYPRIWSHAEYAFYYRSFNRTVVHSNAALAKLRAMRVTVDALVVPHGVYDIFRLSNIDKNSARQRIPGLLATDFVVLFFGHLEPRKGLIPFLDVASSLRGNRKIKFLIAGQSALNEHDPKYRYRLTAARDMPNVILHDKRIAFEEVETYFVACDVVALPYLEGTTSGVLKLAIAFGKPVIASHIGDLVEQMPLGGGIFIDNGIDIEQSFINALEKIQNEYHLFSHAMAGAGKNAQWSEIAEDIANYLASSGAT
jgi:glycosyltransferase involved in cell wall biosynthesis